MGSCCAEATPDRNVPATEVERTDTKVVRDSRLAAGVTDFAAGQSYHYGHPTALCARDRARFLDRTTSLHRVGHRSLRGRRIDFYLHSLVFGHGRRIYRHDNLGHDVVASDHRSCVGDSLSESRDRTGVQETDLRRVIVHLFQMHLVVERGCPPAAGGWLVVRCRFPHSLGH